LTTLESDHAILLSQSTHGQNISVFFCLFACLIASSTK
jgi:hypothetical protein